jgi:thiol-disulfide isomerase/thioredoxin
MTRQSRLLLVLASVAVIATVIGAVYGIGPINGNDGSAQLCDGSRERIARLRGLNTGQLAAFQIADDPVFVGDLTFSDDARRPTGLGDHVGQTVLLNLWATWCVPCREEMPTFAALQKSLGNESFQVLPVSVDNGDDEKPKKFYMDNGLDGALPFRHDGTLATFNTLKKRSIAFGMPVSILVDPKGCAIGWLNGPADWASNDAVKLVTAVSGH